MTYGNVSPRYEGINQVSIIHRKFAIVLGIKFVAILGLLWQNILNYYIVGLTGIDLEKVVKKSTILIESIKRFLFFNKKGQR